MSPPCFFFWGGVPEKRGGLSLSAPVFFFLYQQLCGMKSFGRPNHCETPLFQKQEAEVPAKKKKKCLGATSSSLGVAQLLMGDQLNQQSVPDFSEGTPQGQQ